MTNEDLLIWNGKPVNGDAVARFRVKTRNHPHPGGIARKVGIPFERIRKICLVHALRRDEEHGNS